jgi:hypothetical protein
MALASAPPGALSEADWAEALTAVRQVQDEWNRATAMWTLAEVVPSSLLPEALDAALTIRDERCRVEALCALTPFLTEPLLDKAGKAWHDCKDVWNERKFATAVTARPEELWKAPWSDVFEIATTKGHEINRDMVRSVIEDRAKTDWLSAFMAAVAIQDRGSWGRVQALKALAAPQPGALSEADWCAALAAAQAIDDPEQRADALSALGPVLPEALLPKALATALDFRNGTRARVLSALAPVLPEGLLSQAVAAVRAIEDVWSVVGLLSALGPALPEALRPMAVAIEQRSQEMMRRLREAISARAAGREKTNPPVAPSHVDKSHNNQEDTEQTTGLVADQSHVVLPEMLPLAGDTKTDCGPARESTTESPAQPQESLSASFDAIRHISDGPCRVKALSAAALPGESSEAGWSEALAAARAITYDSDRANALLILARLLPVALLPEAFAATRTIQRDDSRAMTLLAFAPVLPDALLSEALVEARAIQDKGLRSAVLHTLAIRLSSLNVPQLYLLWTQTLPTLASRTRPELLADLNALLPVLFRLVGPKLKGEIYFAIEDVCSWWP